MKAYDVIVAGAGPAGSTAARLLAGRGARVLLLDKQRFPRDKPCGGGVTLRAASLLDVDLAPVIERTIHGARFSLRLGETFDRHFEQPLTYMTQRCRLDAHLAERAAAAGADFHDGEPVRTASFGSAARAPTAVLRHAVHVDTEAGEYRARVLLGADGANGLVGRSFELRTEYEEAVALEGNVPFVGEIPYFWVEFVVV
jgi:flavin-dependent dehydrogenase